MTKRDVLPETVGVEVFAELVGVSPRRVGQLVAEGVVIRANRGQVALAASLRNMLETARAARDPAPLTAARARAADARAALAELRMSREMGALIPVADAIAVMDRVGGLFVAALSGLPARASRDLTVRAEIDRHCDLIRNEIVAEIERIRAENRPKT